MPCEVRTNSFGARRWFHNVTLAFYIWVLDCHCSSQRLTSPQTPAAMGDVSREPRDAPYRFRVPLSTHNGSRFLAEQVKSVLTQRDVQVQLYIRDDCSTDDTIAS